MSKKFWIFLIILAVVAGGFFYFWYVWIPAQMEKEAEIPPETKTQPPTLFGKEDYQIVEKKDGKYIAVEKVGLTCKVPEGWRIEIEGSDIPEPEYRVNLLSPDAEIFDILTKGCGIGITCWMSEEYSQNIENKMKTVKDTSSKLIEGPDEYKYEYEIITLANHVALKGNPSKTNNKFNEFIRGESIDIVMGNNKILSLDTSCPPAFENKCFPIWEEFLKNVVIE